MDELKDEALSIDALLLARSYLYRLFGKVFGGEPNREVVQVLTSANTLDVLDEYAEEAPELKGLRAYLADAAALADRDEAVESAASEFTRVFIGPATLPAIPWGAPYESRDSVMFQKGTLAVREAYREQGLRPVHLQHVPDDHIALECNFMALQSRDLHASFERADVEAVSDGLLGQKAFLDGFMLDWIPQYASELESSGKAPFYARLVAGAGAFVRLDSVFLGEALQWLESGSAANAETLESAMEAVSSAFSEIREGLEAVEALAPKFADEYELTTLS